MNTLGIIFLILTLLAIIIPIIVAIYYKDEHFLFLMVISLFTGIMFALVNYPTVTVDDIKKGKAEYIKEEHVITNEQGDTLNTYYTYKLKWKDGWEYGRQHKRLVPTTE